MKGVVYLKTMIWAHRGASAYAPENTMEAFILAHQMGADGIELDIHLTLDGQIVVAHDETVDRCSYGSGRIIDKSLSDLLLLDFSNGFDNYSNIKIPTLEEVLNFVSKTDMTVNIEIKSGIVIYEGIEEKVLNLVKKMELENRVIYSSFNHYSLIVLRKLNPEAKIGLLYSEAMVDPYIYAKHLKADAIHPYYPTLMVPGTVSGCRENDIKVHPWTVNQTEHMAWMFNEQVDAIITNHPNIAIKVRDKIQN